jgi:pSer/pThr/pTyr-binding forkhead associated (FHA) protein
MDSMRRVTLRVIQGADRGRAFDQLPLPVTIGREDGNSLQLNDERVSRFHAKIQEDNNQWVLTDLGSTNGTRVNGQACELRILRPGDVVSIGRSQLLVGSAEQIIQRQQQLATRNDRKTPPGGISLAAVPELPSGDWSLSEVSSSVLQLSGLLPAPQIPERLSPSQSAQLVELLDFLHRHLSQVIRSAEPHGESGDALVSGAAWQRLLLAQSRIGELLRGISDPDFGQPKL